MQSAAPDEMPRAAMVELVVEVRGPPFESEPAVREKDGVERILLRVGIGSPTITDHEEDGSAR